MSRKLLARSINLRGLAIVSATLVSVLALAPSVARSDEPGPAKAAPPSVAAEKGSAADLAREQQQLAEKYRRFEEVLLRMAELTAPTISNAPPYCVKRSQKASTN